MLYFLTGRDGEKTEVEEYKHVCVDSKTVCEEYPYKCDRQRVKGGVSERSSG